MSKPQITVEKKDQVKSKGMHLISICDMTDGRAKRLEKLIEGVNAKKSFLQQAGMLTEQAMRDLWMEYRWYLDQLNKRFLVRQFMVKNVTTTVGRSVFAQRLVNVTTYTGVVNYCALGTSSTAPAVGDTQLGTETYRKALSPSTYANNIAYLETFFSSTDTNGTFEEFAFFIDGTGSANTGQMFNRFTQSVTKSATESLNVQSTVTIADA